RICEVGGDVAFDLAAAARVRGRGPRAFERAPRALLAARGRRQPARGLLLHAGTILPSIARPGAVLTSPAARGHDAKELAAAQGCKFFPWRFHGPHVCDRYRRLRRGGPREDRALDFVHG